MRVGETYTDVIRVGMLEEFLLHSPKKTIASALVELGWTSKQVMEIQTKVDFDMNANPRRISPENVRKIKEAIRRMK